MPIDATYAAAPFNHAKADIILRSSDNVDFRVFKLFLSLASLFFETLFDVPPPTEEGEEEIKDGLAVIPVTEDSKTLDALLRFCYPCTLTDDPNLDVLKDAIDVLEGARKYSLDAIEKKVRQAIASPNILAEAPLRCFAIAHRGRLREETLLAAKYTLTQPLIPSSFEEIDLITAGDLLSLLTYRHKCGEAVYALRLDSSWVRSYYRSSEARSWLSGQWPGSHASSTSWIAHEKCGCARSNTQRCALFGLGPLQWWEDFMEEVFVALRDKPCKKTVEASAEKTVQAVKARNCQVCSPRISDGMRDFLGLFTRKIEETVSQIELELKFE